MTVAAERSGKTRPTEYGASTPRPPLPAATGSVLPGTTKPTHERETARLGAPTTRYVASSSTWGPRLIFRKYSRYEAPPCAKLPTLAAHWGNSRTRMMLTSKLLIRRQTCFQRQHIPQERDRGRGSQANAPESPPFLFWEKAERTKGHPKGRLRGQLKGHQRETKRQTEGNEKELSS